MGLAGLCSNVGLKEPISFESIYESKTSLKIFIACCTISINYYILAKVNRSFIKEVVHKMKNKEEYKFILDRLEHSIIMVENDQI